MQNRRVLWLGAVLSGLYACGPRVSVGDLGEAGSAGTGGANASGSSNQETGGSSTSGNGQTDPGESIAQGGKDGGGGSTASGAGTTNTPTNSAEGGSMGEGGAVNEASGGTGSGPGNGCPKTLDEFLPPVVASNCPDSVPDLSAPCTVPENAICVWQDSELQNSDPGYTAFGCYASLTGKSWFGGGQGTLGDFGVDPAHCPRQTPRAGSSCAGHAGENCYYPEQFCSCEGGAEAWSCEENPKPFPLPSPVKRLCAPTGIDESKAIKDLTDAEVTTWCSWFGDPSGQPRPKVAKIDPPNLAQTYSSVYKSYGAPACLLDLPIELCAKNLRLRPDCDATLEQLDDCVETMHAAGVVGHGCAPLLSNTKCENVIVQKWDPRQQAPGCPTPLE